jgi:hypothetical protein
MLEELPDIEILHKVLKHHAKLLALESYRARAARAYIILCRIDVVKYTRN